MRRAGLGLLLAAGLLVGCGDKTVDADSAADTVTNFVSGKTGFEPDVDCPSDVKAEVGATFECHFAGPEGPYTASVRITEIDGDDATFFIRSHPDR